jgi:aspartate carbamoyltransferase regulatory subunit
MIAAAQTLLIPKIENGFVIDHIPTGLGIRILQLMSRHREFDNVVVTLGMHYQSKRLGKKDLIKIQMPELPGTFLQQLSLAASGVTIKQVKNFAVAGKVTLQVPEMIQNLMPCPNPNCITRHEKCVTTLFMLVSREPMQFRCNYCERHFSQEEFGDGGFIR